MGVVDKIPEADSPEAFQLAINLSLSERYPKLQPLFLEKRRSIFDRLSTYPELNMDMADIASLLLSTTTTRSLIDLPDTHPYPYWTMGWQASFLHINDYYGVKVWGHRINEKSMNRSQLENRQLRDHELRLASFAAISDLGLMPLHVFNGGHFSGLNGDMFGYVSERANINLFDYMVDHGSTGRQDYLDGFGNSNFWFESTNQTFISMNSVQSCIRNLGEVGIVVHADLIPYNFGIRHRDDLVVTFDYGHCYLL